MKKFYNKRKCIVTSIMLALIMVLTPVSQAGATDFVDIAMFDDADFTDRGSTETVLLQMDSDTISLYATCEDGEEDLVVCHVVGKTNPNFTTTIPFVADGTVWTFPFNFPQGRYYVYFTGDYDILKTYAIAVFTAWVD